MSLPTDTITNTPNLASDNR